MVVLFGGPKGGLSNEGIARQAGDHSEQMAQEGNLERRCCDKASKIQAVIRGFVGSLSEILTEEDLFEDESNVIGSVLCQTEAELKNRLQQLRRRLRTDTNSRVASAFGRDDILAGSSRQSKRACAYSEGGVGICRHICKDHPELMDIALWETLPAEVVERICAMLPVSKIFELLKLCKPWSRLPTATNFRRFCAKAHRDLFGILMSNDNYTLYRLAVYDPTHEEWFHLKLSNMPSVYVSFCEEFDLVFGRDGGLICVIPHQFNYFEEPPRILVFNPLTGDKKFIGVSSFTASIEKEEVYAVVLQLMMDAELGCYKLILVTQRTKRRRGAVYYSESYDSVSGLWSTLDSGFVYGDGLLGEKRYHVCFDCRLKKFCTPAEYGTSVRSPRPLVYFTNVDADYRYDPYYKFVRDHRFKLEHHEEMDESFTAEIFESVWHQNGWNEKSRVKLAMEMPFGGFDTVLLACTRYCLLVADDGTYAESEDCRLRMALYDRVTSEEVLDIPPFMTKKFPDDERFIFRCLRFMCDLKWDAVP